MLQVRSRDGHGPVHAPCQGLRHRRPLRTDRSLVAGQSVADVRAQAVDVDVQLVLRAAVFGIDRQAHVPVRQVVAETGEVQGAEGPGVGQIGLRARPLQLGVLDAGDLVGGDQQVLGLPRAILQHRKAEVVGRSQEDVGAGSGVQRGRLAGRALAVDQLPEHVRVGRPHRRRARQQRRARDEDGQPRHQTLGFHPAPWGSSPAWVKADFTRCSSSIPGGALLLSPSSEAAKLQSCAPLVSRPTYQATWREESESVAQSPPLPLMLAWPRVSPVAVIICSTAWALEAFTGRRPA